MSDLDEYLQSEFEAPEVDEERERFVVDTPEKADWALRKLAAVEARQAENRRLADDRIARVREWLELDPQNLALERDHRFFQSLVANWWRGQLEKFLADAGGLWENVRTKSRNLPSGTVSGRIPPKPPVYRDEAAAAAWFKEHDMDAVVQVSETVKKSDVKALITAGFLQVQAGFLIHTETGEPVPGVEVEVEEPADCISITVKPAQP